MRGNEGRRGASWLVTLAASVGLLAGCASSGSVPAPAPTPQPPPQVVAPPPVTPPPVAEPVAPKDDKVRVGLLLPLSGANAALGQSMLDAAQLALFDLGDEKFTLLPRDTQGSPGIAATAAQGLVEEGAGILLGPLFGAEAAAVKPVAAQAGLSVLSFSSDWNVAGGNVWTLGFQPHEQVRRVVGLSVARGLLRFGVVAPSTPYGDAAVSALREAAEQAGGSVTKVERYTAGATNLTELVKRLSDFDQRQAALGAERSRLQTLGDPESLAALRRLSNADTFGPLPFDAVLIAEGGQTLRELAALFPFFDIDPGPVRMLGTGLWDEGGLGREGALVGGWFAAPAPEGRDMFEARFQQAFGYRPHRLATLAYDATALAAVLARNGGFAVPSLMNPNGFAGAEGIFRLLPTGTAERGLAVMEVTRTGTTQVDPAPQSFVTTATPTS
ncbi:penicillin-binding protein activator [Niveispirillum sp. KHB5.9]|uniref:penicillin-binding protein activator n=1 Tax=Niveispirillum sp. KHB5.9 TaxID=3400269 RepID=UPI003A835120